MNDERLHDDFRLIMYVSFQSRKEAIALPLMEGLSNLTQTKGFNGKFRLLTRFSEDNEPRWDSNFIEEQLQSLTKSKGP